MLSLSNKIERLVLKRKAILISELARELNIRRETVSDIVRSLAESGQLVVQNKGICKIILPGFNSAKDMEDAHAD